MTNSTVLKDSLTEAIVSDEIQLGGDGVKSILSAYSPQESIAEYIWNGFDAGATSIDISYEENELGSLRSITIADNGSGIPQGLLSVKFKPFHESEKALNKTDSRHHSLVHGKNGVGRLTFFTFANIARWTTIYEKNSKLYKYDIEIKSDDLHSYTGAHSPVSKIPYEHGTSTKVTFEGIRELSSGNIETTVKQYLLQEFCWFLELFKDKMFSISINGSPLDYREMIAGERDEKIIHDATSTRFDVKYIQWKKKLNKEFSRYYLIDSTGKENYKSTTLLNNKGDKFYHSVYIRSDYFDMFSYEDKIDYDQSTLQNKEQKFNSKRDEEFKYVISEINDYLRRMRSPHLQKMADDLVEKYEKENIIPEVNNSWEIPRNNELKTLIKDIYKIHPKIFGEGNSSIEQRKTFIHLLNALLDSNQRDQIYTIIDAVVRLDDQEQKQLADLLKVNKLNSIIQTIKMIQNRYTTIDALKEIVFNDSFNSREVDHVQKVLDHNFWVFGEEYNLVSSTEAKFEKALSEYLYILRGGKKQDVNMESPDKNKEMDLFLCRKSIENDRINNLVIELKRPAVLLGEKEVSQIKRYQRTIFSDSRFNGDNTYWDFVLVGNKFNESGYIEGEIDTNKGHGEKEKGLIFSKDNCKIYVRKWSDIFADVECRHKFIENELKTERNRLASDYANADEATERAIKK